jgi:hypothetical protein
MDLINQINVGIPRWSNKVYENKEAKASQGGTIENERKYFILGSIRNIFNNPD